MRIAIVDDNERFAKKICKTTETFFEKRGDHAIIDVFHNGHVLVNCIEEKKTYDIYLLDIEMPSMSGLVVLEKIRKFTQDGYVIFITSHEQYAIESIHNGIFDYIMKLGYEKDLYRVLERICAAENEKKEKYYAIWMNSKYQRIRLDQILYIGREEKDAIFFCRNNKTYIERQPLKVVYKNLPEKDFAYVNSGQIANLRHVSKYADGQVDLNDEVFLVCSRRLKKQFESKLLDHWGKM